MVGYSVVVCLPPGALEDLHAAIEAALAPFRTDALQAYSRSLTGESWRVAKDDGRQGFWVVPGREDDARLIRGESRRGCESASRVPWRCKGGPRELLDLEPEPLFTRTLIERARRNWQDLTTGLTPEDWVATVATALAEEAAATYDEASRDAYFNGHLMDMAASGRGARDLLTLDGWWIEMDGLYHHGGCDAQSGCGHWPESFARPSEDDDIEEAKARYLRDLPSDIILVAVHGHC